MKKTIIMMLLALVAITVSAQTYSYLRFVFTDATEVAYSVNDIIVTYDDTNVYVNNADGTATIPLTIVSEMYFSNNGNSDSGHGYEPGDVDHSGDYTITDVTILIDRVLANESIGDNCCDICADVDGDGDIAINDVTALIDLVLAGNSSEN